MRRSSPRSLRRRASRIRLLMTDVDGVLTDGSIIILNSGEEIKFWNVKDRIAHAMLKRSDRRYYTAWVTARRSLQVQTRADEIQVDALLQDCHDKGRGFRELLKRFGLTAEEALYIGDDLVDLPALHQAGLAACPSDASEPVRRVCQYVARSAGGRGVFREVVDMVLQSQGQFNSVLKSFEG